MVEEGKVREFARAVKSSNPAYLPRARSRRRRRRSWRRRRSGRGRRTRRGATTKLNWERLLHGEQEFVFSGPPPAAGTELTAEARIDRVFEKEGKRGGTMTFVEVVTEYRDGSGAVVAEARVDDHRDQSGPAMMWDELEVGTVRPPLWRTGPSR